MTCPKCGGDTLYVDADITGGCQCGDGESYCYCNSLDIHIDFRCNNMIDTPYGTQGRTRRIPCGYSHRAITDKYALERYMKENYKLPKDETLR